MPFWIASRSQWPRKKCTLGTAPCQPRNNLKVCNEGRTCSKLSEYVGKIRQVALFRLLPCGWTFYFLCRSHIGNETVFHSSLKLAGNAWAHSWTAVQSYVVQVVLWLSHIRSSAFEVHFEKNTSFAKFWIFQTGFFVSRFHTFPWSPCSFGFMPSLGDRSIGYFDSSMFVTRNVQSADELRKLCLRPRS